MPASETHAPCACWPFEHHRQRPIGERLVKLVALEALLDDGAVRANTCSRSAAREGKSKRRKWRRVAAGIGGTLSCDRCRRVRTLRPEVRQPARDRSVRKRAHHGCQARDDLVGLTGMLISGGSNRITRSCVTFDQKTLGECRADQIAARPIQLETDHQSLAAKSTPPRPHPEGREPCRCGICSPRNTALARRSSSSMMRRVRGRRDRRAGRAKGRAMIAWSEHAGGAAAREQRADRHARGQPFGRE